jgi:hypothetical protein
MIARAADAAARALAARWDQDATVLTCADLGVGRTELRHPRFLESSVTAEGRSIDLASVTGVVNLLPAVSLTEISFYPEEERDYQAAEFHALLLFVLSALKCPIINRASTLSLNGPVFNALGWYHLANRAGIPLAPVLVERRRLIPGFDSRQEELIEVAVMGNQLLMGSGTVADTYIARLAKEANIHYLAARFWRKTATEMLFASASCVLDPKAPWVEGALKRVLKS